MLKVIIASTTHRVKIQSIGPRGIQGEIGPTGAQGAQGNPGQGVPVGGSVGQYLAKDSSTDFDTSWQDFPDPAWGDLTGDITDQLDLMSVLDAKQDVITPGTTLQYYRGDKTFQTLNTAIVPESGNLYYTQGRFDAALAAKSTSDLSEGSNLYYTNDRADARITLQKAAANGLATLDGSTKIPVAQLPALTTTDITEGSRLYYTQDRFDTAFAAKTTANLTESGNLYHTTTRVQTVGDARYLKLDSSNGPLSGNLGLGIAASNKLSVSGNVDIVGNLGIGTTSPNSKLDVRGGFATPISNKTTTYPITSSDHTITCDATAGAFTVTLPTAASISGREYCIKKTDVSGNAITVATTSSQTIDGSTTYSLPTQFKHVTVKSNGANWVVVSNN